MGRSREQRAESKEQRAEGRGFEQEETEETEGKLTLLRPRKGVGAFADPLMGMYPIPILRESEQSSSTDGKKRIY